MEISKVKETVTKKERERFLKKYPTVKDWYNAKHQNKRYLSQLIKYCRAVNKTPLELLELKKSYGDIRAEQLLESFQSEYIQKYGEDIKGRKYPDALVFNITTAVKSWYTYNGRTLARKRATITLRLKRRKEPFTKEELIKFSDGFTGNKRVEFKAIVSFLSSMPCRIDTLVKLDWYHVREALDDSIQTPKIEIEPELLKRSLAELNIPQRGFLHSWARKCLLEWRDTYERMTKTRIDLANEQSLKKPLWIVIKKQKGRWNRLSPLSIELWFRQRSKEYGKRIIPHSFRAFVRDALNCSEDFKALMLGQKGKYSFAYTFALEDWKRLKEAFLEAEPRINPLYTSNTEKYKSQLESLEREIGERFSEKQKDAIARALAQGYLRLETEYKQKREKFMMLFTEEVKKAFKEVSEQ